MSSNSISRSVIRVAVGVILVLALPFVAMQFGDEVVWTFFDFVFAGVMLTIIGVTIEMAVWRVGNIGIAVGIAILGVLAGIAGELDDAPGLVLMGMMLIGGAIALGIRARRPVE